MSEIMTQGRANEVEFTCEIVAAYVTNNILPSGDVPQFIQNIYSSIASISAQHNETLGQNKLVLQPAVETGPQPAPELKVQPRQEMAPDTKDSSPSLPSSGAISIRKSLANPEYIISMIDGKPYKLLARQLARYGLTPDQYRKHFKLPSDYPVVAPAYSERRRNFAIKSGLGSKERVRTKK